MPDHIRPTLTMRLRNAIRSRLVNVVQEGARGPLEDVRRAVTGVEQSVAQRDREVSDELRSIRADTAKSSGLAGDLSSMRAGIEALRGELAALSEQVADVQAIAAHHYDRIPELRTLLLEARRTEEYAATLADNEPLISVRIATYNRPDLLFDRALPSVLAQTYERLEIVVVGDGCDDETVSRAAAVTDPRLRFVNLPHRGSYPTDPWRRWLVAGSVPMNAGAQMATGRWIAPLDHDDTFAPDHVEVLLDRALRDGFEMVYGRMRSIPPAPWDETEIGVYPPEHAQFSFGSAMYMSALRFFQYDTSSWVLGEPGDWNLCRRMLEAGVRIGFVPRVVGVLYPTGPGVAPPSRAGNAAAGGLANRAPSD